MKPNVGGFDRVFRVFVGLGVIAAGVYFHSWWGALGLIPLTTAILRWCPTYIPFGTSTAKEPSPGAPPAQGARPPA